MVTGSERFHELLRELGELHDQKQADYGSSSDPFANLRSAKLLGIEPWKAALIRANDKMSRLQTFARTGTLNMEGVIDSFKDLAVYAIIMQVLYEDELGGE